MEQLTVTHLEHVGQLAKADLDGLIARRPHRAYLRERILCIALCQGAALHWIDGENGVKDIDVWTFYAAEGADRYPERRRGTATYPDSGLTGWSERVDLLGRSIASTPGDPVGSLVRYLSNPPTGTAWFLSQKAAVLIEPAERVGEIIWPEATRRIR